MKDAFLLMGSNTGNSREILAATLKEITQKIGRVVSLSSIYATQAWGKQNQPDFLNQLLVVETSLPADELLKELLTIEKGHGRVRDEKWGPRTLDIDILYLGDEIVVNPDLKIPHPEIQNRNFALIPLVEVAPSFKHPVFNITNEELLKRSPDTLEVRKL